MHLDYLLLGLLSQGPRSDAVLRRASHSSLSPFWTARPGEISESLTQILGQGWATIRSDASDEETYVITPKGQSALLQWVARPPSPEVVYMPCVLQALLAGLMADETAIATLEMLTKKLNEAVKDGWDNLKGEPHAHWCSGEVRNQALVCLAAEGGLHLAQARQEWLTGLLNRIKTRAHTQSLGIPGLSGKLGFVARSASEPTRPAPAILCREAEADNLVGTRDPFLAQVSFASALPNGQVIAIFRAKAQELRSTITSSGISAGWSSPIEEVGLALSKDRFWALALEWGRWMARAKLDWVEQAIRRIQDEAPLRDPRTAIRPK